MKGKKKKHQQASKNRVFSYLETKSILFLLFIYLLVGVIVYAPSLSGKFLLDDNQYIVYNSSLQNFNSLKQELVLTKYRRPFYWFSFFIEKRLWGNNPSGYKIVNLVFHILAAFVLFLFVRDLLRKRFTGKEKEVFYFSFFTGLFFVVCPVATEAVSYISGRSSGIGGFFFILSVYFFQKCLTEGKIKDKVVNLIVAFVAGIIAVMFKEVYVVFLILWFVLFVNYADLSGINALKLSLSLVVVALCLSFAVFYVRLQPFPLIKKTIKYYSKNINQEALATNIYAVAYSLRLAVFPDKLNIDHDLPVIEKLADYRAVLSFAFLIALFFVFWFFRNQMPLSFFAYLSYLLLIAPTNSFILRRGQWMIDPLSERNLYPSLFFFSIILFEVLWLLSGKDLKRFKAFSILVIVIFGVRAFTRNMDYKNNIAMWAASLKYSPERARPNFNYAAALKEAGRYGEAIPYAEKAFRLSPAPNTLGLLSSLYKLTGNTEKYEILLSTALEKKQFKSPYLYHQLGEYYYEKGDFAKAEDYFKKAIKMKWCYVLPRLSLAYIYLMQNKLGKAKEQIDILNDIVEEQFNKYYCNVLIDSIVKARVMFANSLYCFSTHQYDKGVGFSNLAIQLNPEFTEPYVKLGEYYFLNQQDDKALYYFNKAKETPDFKKYKKQVDSMLKQIFAKRK